VLTYGFLGLCSVCESLCGGGKWDVIVLNGPDARGSNADPLKALLAEPILAANSRRLYV